MPTSYSILFVVTCSCVFRSLVSAFLSQMMTVLLRDTATGTCCVDVLSLVIISCSKDDIFSYVWGILQYKKPTQRVWLHISLLLSIVVPSSRPKLQRHTDRLSWLLLACFPELNVHFYKPYIEVSSILWDFPLLLCVLEEIYQVLQVNIIEIKYHLFFISLCWQWGKVFCRCCFMRLLWKVWQGLH